ncbi:MAG: tetratricopeptide repeat protein [Planctomycetaceae bacterium]|nr:tetratricopeptide repeat protein [Planctomycetaceae bacterium]
METPAASTRRRYWITCLFVALIAMVTAGWAASRWRSGRLCETALRAFAAEEYDVARSVAIDALWWDRSSTRAQLIAGDSAKALGRNSEAVERYDRLPMRGRGMVTAHSNAAKLLLYDLGDPSGAERRFRQVLSASPGDPDAVLGLADLLGITSRRWEAIPLLLDVLRQGRFRTEHLTLLGAEGGAHPAPELLRSWMAKRPDDPLANLAMAWQLRNERQYADAERCLRLAIKQGPKLIEAHARLGELLVESGRFDELAGWQRSLPAGSDEFPQIWIVQGAWARHCGDDAGAIRCYLEALARNPNLTNANYQLAQLLHSRADVASAAPFFERCAALQELSARESVLFHSEHTSLDPLRNVAEQMEALGRLWEAWGWSRFAKSLSASAAWPQAALDRLEVQLAKSPPWNLPETNPALSFDAERFALPDWSRLQPAERSHATGATDDLTAQVSFHDMARDAELDFRYFNSGDPSTPGQYMYEFTGGGVAVLDFDADGWPDLYLTQGSQWPPDGNQQIYLDQLFRNQFGKKFDNVTLPAEMRENSFSHGVAAGDLDGDGFVDLFVANIGRNRLLINQGDGTFREQWLPGDRGLWTTSCVIADFNGDAFPDLYAVNYVEAPDVFDRLCAHKDGVPRMCAPFDFPGSPDEFYLNQGDGTFREAASEAGFVDHNGKGLGVAAADFDSSGRLSLFVANDLVENFYFVNETSVRGGAPRFVESALPLGLAYGADGRTHGCMGIAVGDSNDDGRLDMLVTNFMQEPDALYVQKPGGFFADEADRAGIGGPTLLQLGFGTQFVDGDLDGRLDLVVTNGHVDDHRAYGREYHMPPQFFHNVGGGRFRELPPDRVGEFFGGKYLGRGMARIDWNRDGAEDVVISHLESPAALLTNTTVGRGDFIKVDLRGVRSERDAIGAVATLTTASLRLVRQVTAGDGYQASNERSLIFGLGKDDSAADLMVRWPSGAIDEIANVPRNRHWILIEGSSRLRSLP